MFFKAREHGNNNIVHKEEGNNRDRFMDIKDGTERLAVDHPPIRAVDFFPISQSA